MSPSQIDEPILVAGAGIGGLSAAIALARLDQRVRVLERAPVLSTAGAGIQLGANATRILRHWGVLDRLWPAAVRAGGIGLGDGLTGKPLATVPLGEAAEERYGAPYLLVHRADLQRALLEAASDCPQVEILTGCEVTGFAQSPGEIVVHTARNDIPCRGLIAADGVWSELRAHIDPSAALQFVDHTAWRTLIDPSALPEDLRGPWVGLWMARNAHLVHYPVRAGGAINVVAVIRERWARLPGWDVAADRDVLLDAFASWDKRLRDVLASAEQWRKWALYDLPPLARWTRGTATLLGDAAHPVMPFLAQGGAMAIEDAAVLARLVADCEGELWRAFETFETARMERTARMRQESRRTGAIYHMSGPAKWARDWTLRRRSADALLGRFDWIYRFDALGE